MLVKLIVEQVLALAYVAGEYGFVLVFYAEVDDETAASVESTIAVDPATAMYFCVLYNFFINAI